MKIFRFNLEKLPRASITMGNFLIRNQSDRFSKLEDKNHYQPSTESEKKTVTLNKAKSFYMFILNS